MKIFSPIEKCTSNTNKIQVCNLKKINPANILQGSFHFYMCFGHGQTTTELYFNLLSLGWTISRDKINCYTSKISGLCDKMFHRSPSKIFHFQFRATAYFIFFPINVETRETILEKKMNQKGFLIPNVCRILKDFEGTFHQT